MAVNKFQQELFQSEDKNYKPVICLGMTFKNDEERRKYFTEELRKKLPELKKIEGFPIGEDEDILALSDPPYYTACPNPFIPDFIKQWEEEKREMYGEEGEEEYHREPFAADVQEGKGNEIYNAHNYHTKVPHKAIMRYILHYTKPGDIVFDGFCGTGMTSVAAQMCGDLSAIQELGFRVSEDDNIIDQNGHFISKFGPRQSVINDLSTAATFIAYNYNYPLETGTIRKEADNILQQVKKEYGWMYKTNHLIEGQEQFDSRGEPVKGDVLYTVWSQVFICPYCSEQMVFWDVAVDRDEGKINDNFECSHCNAIINKRGLEKCWETSFDETISQTVKQVKYVPVLICYKVENERFLKKPDSEDIKLIDDINKKPLVNWVPSDKVFEGDKTIEALRLGFTNVHHFYTKRNLLTLSMLFKKAEKNQLKFILTGMLTRASKQARFLAKNFFHGGGGWVGTSLSGTLFFPSLSVEVSPIFTFQNRIHKTLTYRPTKKPIITTQSTQDLSNLAKNTVDYIFTDPPFGGNLMYSELNLNHESWLKVFTNKKTEALVNKHQRKNLYDYQEIIELCFRECYRILKPNRWITVEFSNSQANVWNAIQEAMQRAGFIIANVFALDKKQGSFNAVTSTTAVKQDLIISAYKPSDKMKRIMQNKQNSPESALAFVKEHLQQLPKFLGQKGEAQLIVERTPRVLFDRMVAYHVQNGYPVPISSAEFQTEVAQRFPMRDGMVFLEDQVAEYDKKRLLAKEFVQMNLFVSDENSAIEWLRQQLLKKPLTRQDLHPNFMKEIQHIAKHEDLPELDELLEQNFLRYDGEGPVPSQIHGYLSTNFKDLRGLDKEDPALKQKARYRWYVPDPNKQADLEKLREKALLREFSAYVEQISSSRKKLKQFRTEAIRAGFKKAWSEKDYRTIVSIGEKLPEKVLQEDDKLLMYFDNAQIYLDS